MDTKTPVVMIVLVDAGRLRWFVAETAWSREVCPLLRSSEGDLSPCLELEGEERIAFLRVGGAKSCKRPTSTRPVGCSNKMIFRS